MLTEYGSPKEKARAKAKRLWNNTAVGKKQKEERAKPKLVDPDAPPRIAEVIINEGRLGSKVKRFETKFKREIREMIEGHQKLSLQIYVMSLEHRRRRLLAEKLKRLKAKIEAEKNIETPKDLFGFPIERRLEK